MKTRNSSIKAAITAMLAILLLLAGCRQIWHTEPDKEIPPPPSAKPIEIVGNSLVPLGVTTQLEAQFVSGSSGSEEETPTITQWKTGDSAIASVDANGVVTGVALGSTFIQAISKDNENSPLHTLTVYQVSLHGGSEVGVGGSIVLVPKVEPAIGTEAIDLGAIDWQVEPDNGTVAITVDPNTGEVTVTGVVEGEVTLVGTDENGGSTEVTIEVVDPWIDGVAYLAKGDTTDLSLVGTYPSGTAINWGSAPPPQEDLQPLPLIPPPESRLNLPG